MNQEGHVRVVWINSNDIIAPPRYTVTFACYEPPEEFATCEFGLEVDLHYRR